MVTSGEAPSVAAAAELPQQKYNSRRVVVPRERRQIGYPDQCDEVAAHYHHMPLVPEHLVCGWWRVHTSKPWKRSEHICVVETRAAVETVRVWLQLFDMGYSLKKPPDHGRRDE